MVTKQDFDALATVLAKYYLLDSFLTLSIARDMADYFIKANPNFNRLKWYDAIGYEVEFTPSNNEVLDKEKHDELVVGLLKWIDVEVIAEVILGQVAYDGFEVTLENAKAAWLATLESLNKTVREAIRYADI